jgi:hypothetical protein
MVSWQHEEEYAMILNVDGSPLTNLSTASCGGLIEKHEGSFQFGFFKSVGISNILHAEIHILLIGLKLC